MPQFDIFFYFNTMFFFLLWFIILYFTMSFYFLPRMLSVLKMRKQKFDHLTKLKFVYAQRFHAITSLLVYTGVSIRLLLSFLASSFAKYNSKS